jgi:glycine dehydrogenase subunit 1
VVNTPIPAQEIVDELADQLIYAGIPLSKFFVGRKNQLMIAVTEKRTKEEIDTLIQALSEVKR